MDRISEYSKDEINKRIQNLEQKIGFKLKHIPNFIEPTKNYCGNVEKLIGTVQIPVGITGPIKINGEHAQGDFYVPFATLEGAIVTTYNAGMHVLTKSGGVTTKVLGEDVHISPLFLVNNLRDAEAFIEWIDKNLSAIKKEAEITTKHGKLKKISPFIMGRRVVLKFSYDSADAQGLNMVNVATEKACQFISERTHKKYFIRSNYSSIKKFSTHNIALGYGKAVFAEAVIPEKNLRLLRVTPQEMFQQFISCYYVSSHAGMIGINAQITNGLTAIFLACGQDPADISTAHVGYGMCEITEEGDLYVCNYLPNLLIGTVGGGTGLAAQRECLEIMDCYGNGKVKKLAEIIAATTLAGEVATTAAIANGTFVQAHANFGRNKPMDG
ncbi:MAG: hydroxymethylglutaryl-CoA reductase [Candidatus Saganbacteria bacterium]|nr:hydroxymethylglutaryl-CoA reductase [Candidatus Saganbacteria bacterium]